MRNSTLRITLIANAGLLMTYEGTTLMIDGIYGREGHPFSNLTPEVWQDMRVPEVLMSGHHENIRKWRRKQSLELTRQRRPDMFEKIELTREDKKLLEK